ncbi:MAG: glycosyltransferase family 4 protein [Gemmatimonadota bacterium]
MRVVAFAPYPERGPSTWFRLAQFRTALEQRGVDLQLEPFLTDSDYLDLYGGASEPARVGLLLRAWRRRWHRIGLLRSDEVVVVQRELAPLGGHLLLRRLRPRPGGLVYDFDDALYLSGPGRHRLAALLRRPGRATDDLCRTADQVFAGNATLAEHAREARGSGEGVRVVPTVVDAGRYRPAPKPPSDGRAVVGWVGSHTALPYLEGLYSHLAAVASEHPFRFRVVCNRPPATPPAPLELEFEQWTPERRVACVQELDIGLYPVTDDAWSRGKCGLKAIEYMACGLPVVCSPVGVLKEMVQDGVSGVHARDGVEWRQALLTLLRDPERQRSLGRAGRSRVETHYSIEAVIDDWVENLQALRAGRRRG